MPIVHFGKKDEPGFELNSSPELIAVRTRSKQSISRAGWPVATPVSSELSDGTLVASYPEAGVEVYRVPVAAKGHTLADRKAVLRASPEVRFAGSVLVNAETNEPVLYTENLFIKFVDGADPKACAAVLENAGLTIKEQVSYAQNAFFTSAPEGTGQKVFDIANELFQREDVEYCHPELIHSRARKAIYRQQWHLKKTKIGEMEIDEHANVAAAHKLTRGAGVTIAIIDDGIDIDHAEFAGENKVVAPRDATLMSNNPRPKHADESHGTACAGVACANGTKGASGVAPLARLLPIRLASGLGSKSEADAFIWAAKNGADIISCSWGPPDGQWWARHDPHHDQVWPIPPSTRLAIDFVTANGRGGKGCVVLFAAGNGNESVDNDGYASYEKVIAVAACNDQGKRSVYSDFGKALWCAFPSNDFEHSEFNHPAPLTPGIWTTDRINADGYNVGKASEGDRKGNYTNSFGGTSSACPGAAGIAALVLSTNPGLKWTEVKDIFRRACDKIDVQAGGYDAAGHSRLYGYGRLNAHTAVKLAKAHR